MFIKPEIDFFQEDWPVTIKQEEVNAYIKEEVPDPVDPSAFTEKRERLRCGYCKKSFLTKSRLRKHILEHIDNKEYKCEYCSAVVSQKLLMAAQRDKKYLCKVCGKENLIKNLIRGYAENFKEPLECHTCGKTYRQVARLDNHLNKHVNEMRHQCEICGKTFLNLTSLRRHAASEHRGAETVECDWCRKKSLPTIKEELVVIKEPIKNKADEPRQQDGDSFASFFLENIFKNRYSESSSVPNLIEKKPKCEVCHKIFHSKYLLFMHQNIHTKELQFPCGLCGKVFFTRSDYRTHKMIHKRCLMECWACGKDIKRLDMESHMKTQHMQKQNGAKRDKARGDDARQPVESLKEEPIDENEQEMPIDFNFVKVEELDYDDDQ
ncbi:zinc finger protein 468-like [Anthonomus grandis grandis]|uniref:zinc finger protein 468-like n=1 Tax=Anthonomus grandis grandis TaxID=2921223 RepID=UPI002165444E|nr:zinc finger protein 468-like [Anthonomus grandis grandis]